MLRRVVALGCVAAALAGAPAAAAATGPVLRLGASQVTWSALDPQVGTFDSTAWSLLHATCTTLVTYSETKSFSAGDVVRPDGATAFPRISPDGRTYTFTIRRGLRFSDGTRVLAANYAAAIGRLQNPLLNSDMAFEAADITAAHGRGRTLVIRLRHADGGLLDRLALPPFCPIPLDFPIDPAGITLTAGSGPYHVASLDPFHSVLLLPNRFYPGPRARRFDEITFTVTGTPQSLVEQVAAGTLDYSYDGVPPSLAATAVKRYRLGAKGLLAYKPFAGIVYLPLNERSPLFKNNLPLRRAVEYALDRSEIVRQFGADFGERRLGQLIPPGFPGHGRDDYPLHANVQLARRLARGHLRGGHLVYYGIASPQYARVASIIAYDLRQIGLTVDVRTFNPQVEQRKLFDPAEPWDIGTAFWLADNADVANFVTPLVGPTGAAAIQDPAFVARLRNASRLSGVAREQRFAGLAHAAVSDEAALAPLFSFTQLAIAAPRLSCVSYNTMWDLNVTSACLRGF
jgi:peptide/nickel transport system substrate-binding protein